MAKKLVVKSEVEKIVNKAVNSSAIPSTPAVSRVHPLTQEFGNGDLNILRDKLNEVIKTL